MDNIYNERLKINELNIFSEEQVKKLQEYNISTAEQFVGACATHEGFNGIRQLLGLTQIQLDQMLYLVKKQLPSDIAEMLSKPITKTPPLGARKPRKKQNVRKS